MGFPGHIKRTVQLAHPSAKVWAALTTAEGLGAWFGDEATIDLRPGGAARLPEDTYRKAFDGHTEGWRRELGEMAAYLDAA
jgi:Activator of Hsp90 ATPase homolog 1-like protein